MTSINASTKHTIKKKVLRTAGTAAPTATKTTATKTTATKKGALAKKDGKRGSAPTLKPKNLKSPESIAAIANLSDEEFKVQVNDVLRQVLGGQPSLFGGNGIGAPRTASTSLDRQGAAADLAAIVKAKGTINVLKKCGILQALEKNLIPNGIGAVFGNEKGMNRGGGMKRITSTVSLASLGTFEGDDLSTIVSDTKRGKTNPPEAREGCLLFIRALVEIVGKPSEPFVVPLLAAALEECSSSSSFVRDAAEDTIGSIIQLANGHAVPKLIFPVLFEALQSPEWRVKAMAMQTMSQIAGLHSRHVSRLLPEIVPEVTAQVWDTKPQVTKAAREALLACASTNINPDVAPAVPAIVHAICKPNDTVKAIDELKCTTFVASVDSSTLAILCPVLARGLKEKMAVNKRSTCIVIENMSRLVETPNAVAPFGPLLVPELKKVAENVQFEEIRDAALAALSALTKALGHDDIDSAISSIMKEEYEKNQVEQQRISDEKAAEVAREEEMQKKEDEERKLWREAMETQRLLNELTIREEEERKAEDYRKKEMAKNSTKAEDGKCQGCGLKKCKKTCLFKK
jgi:hypothetical protein